MSIVMSDNQTSMISAGEDDVQQYLKDIGQFPLLSEQEERALALRCASGDEDAIRRMVSSNLRLVVNVAREYAGRGVPLLDLIQEGSIGLLAAAKRFDPDLGFRFSTYATKWIRSGVLHCLEEHGSVIRIPGYTAERIRKVLSVRSALQQRLGEEPSVQQIAAEVDVPAEKVKQLLQLLPKISSLDAPAGEDTTLSMLLEDIQAPHPQEQLILEELSLIMDTLLSELNERQRMVLRLHFGMEDGICHSLEDISIRYGVSKERVRQIERQAMEHLKKNGAGFGLEDFLNE